MGNGIAWRQCHTCEALFGLWVFLWGIMLNRFTEVGRPALKVGSTIPLAWVLGSTKRRKELSTSICLSLSASWPWVGYGQKPWLPCPDGLYPWTVIWNKPFLSRVAIARIFYHSNMKETKTESSAPTWKPRRCNRGPLIHSWEAGDKRILSGAC